MIEQWQLVIASRLCEHCGEEIDITDLQGEIDSLKRQIETFEEVNGDLIRRNNEYWTVRKQQAADLAQCRALLAALVAEEEEFARLDAQPVSRPREAWVTEWEAVKRRRADTLTAIRAWLAAHPALDAQEAGRE